MNRYLNGTTGMRKTTDILPFIAGKSLGQERRTMMQALISSIFRSGLATFKILKDVAHN